MNRFLCALLVMFLAGASVPCKILGQQQKLRNFRSLIGEVHDEEDKVVEVKFGPTAFFNNNFFCGATNVPADGSYSLSRASIVLGLDDNSNLVYKTKIYPLASTITTSGEETKVNGDAGNHPLNGKIVDNLKLMNLRFPVATIQMEADSTLETVILITNDQSGQSVFTNKAHELHDAADVKLSETQKISSVAVSSDTIFLAIPASGGDFGAVGSGFVRFKKSNDDKLGLQMQSRNGSVAQDFAYRLNIEPHSTQKKYPVSPLLETEQVQVSFTDDPSGCPYITGAFVGPIVDMHWNKKLKRLYVGLGQVTGENRRKGGVVSVLVGRVDEASNTMIMHPIFPFDYAKKLFPSNDISRIVGYFHSDASRMIASALKVRTMSTSTGQEYLIVNGGVDRLYDKARLSPLVWALPLVPQKLTQTKDNEEKYIGLLASKNNRSIVVTRQKDLFSSNDRETIVGVSPAYLDHNVTATGDDPAPDPLPPCMAFLEQTEITDMNVVGDSVFVSVSGIRDEGSRKEQGIFKSTALFSENGNIRAWTPWERVMGRIESVLGFGVDTDTQNYFYLDDGQSSVKVTQWGKGDLTLTDSGGIHNGKPLSTILDGFVGSNRIFGSVYGLFNFDDETVGFQPYSPHKEFAQFSMMVATGHQKIAIIETGKRNGSNVFQQTGEFVVADGKDPLSQNVYIFNDNALKNIEKIYAAEVARSPLPIDKYVCDGNQWLIVGGSGGIAVLQDLFGYGWITSKGHGLVRLATGTQQDFAVFPGKGYSFKQLFDSSGNNIFKETRKLVSDGKFLYIITNRQVWRYEMNDEDVRNGKIAKERLVLIFDATLSRDENGGFFLQNNRIVDFLLVDVSPDARRFLLFTSRGIWLNLYALKDDGTSAHSIPVLSAIDGLAWSNRIGNDGGKGSDLDVPFELGSIASVELISSSRGGKFINNKLDANIYVRAGNEQNTELAMYRFNIQPLDDLQNPGSGKVFVRAFKEPYFNGEVFDLQSLQVKEENRTRYFYRIGKIKQQAAISFGEPLNIPFSFNNYAVPFEPKPEFFDQAGLDNSSIDLKQEITFGTSFPKFVRDTASGAVYVSGFFGVAVNE